MNRFESDRPFVAQPNPKSLTEKGFIPSAPFYKFQDTRLQLALPRGELESSVKQFMREIGA